MKVDPQEFVTSVIADSSMHMGALKIVRDLGLPDCWIGAGFIRSAVWDRLHAYPEHTPLADIDVLYFDPADCDALRDRKIEMQLTRVEPLYPWSVHNQARMHVRNGDAPYTSTENALRYWLETPTCVAVRLELDGRVSLIAPYGLDDLIAMRGAPTPSGQQKAYEYRQRMQAKNWPSIWPKVTVMDVAD